jgi:SAM-dependent methyltransferase
MYKQYRTDITPSERATALDTFWSEHWGGLEIDVLKQGLERTDLWRLFKKWIPPDSVIFEAGCGPGHWVKFLEERGYKTIGLDLSRSALIKSKRSVPELNVALGDLSVTPFRDGVFDAYVSLGVIEHFEDGPDRILAEAARVVKPGGLLFFGVPYLSLAKRLHILHARQNADSKSVHRSVFYQYVMSGRELRRLLVRAGFDVLNVSCYEVEGGLQNRLPGVGKLKERIRDNPRRWIRRAVPALHAGWDLFLRLLPAPALAHMVMAVCRKPIR